MGYQPENFNVWAEIPVRDLKKAVAYYSAVTGATLSIEDMGPNPVATFKPKDPDAGVSGHLYPGTPATDGAGPTIHLATEGKLEDALDRVWKAGGKVISEPVQIPPGRFAYTVDPDGNSIGLFEVA